MSVAAQKEGFVAVPGGRVWYKIAGDGPGMPLLLLHGGPGAGHDYLEPLEALADDRPVVFYDQLGCGKSDIPQDESLWQVERFVDEVGAVRDELKLDRVHILGSSWGGFLAIEYMLTAPSGVESVVLSNAACSTAGFAREVRKRLQNMPADVRETVERCEAAGDFEAPEYQAATLAFYAKHMCRLEEWPEAIMRTVANVAATPTYELMWGPSEFTVRGTLAGWDRSDRLGEISAPTLVISGPHDEAGPALAEELQKGIPGAELAILDDTSHMPMWEQPEAFFRTLREFLARAEEK